MKNEEIDNEALSELQNVGPPMHARDEIAPETGHEVAALIEEGYESDDNFAIFDPDTNANALFQESDQPISPLCPSVLEVNQILLSDIKYRSLVQ